MMSLENKNNNLVVCSQFKKKKVIIRNVGNK